jgi:hypothetical protein
MTATSSRVDRLLAAYPLLLAYLLLLILYAWQTTKHPTPWLFTDELEWAQRSRGVARHGVEQLRGQDAGFTSLYAYLIAPGWWAGSTSSGYAAIKYLDAAVMTASLFPGYALARLFAPRWPAMACGVATAAIPSLVYAGVLIPEPAAYFWSTLALWLLARALFRPTRWPVAAAVVALVLAPFVRSELMVLVLVAIVGAVGMAATGARGRALIGSWDARERVGAALLVAGGAVVLGAFANHHSSTWEIGTHFHDRVFTYGLWAIGAFTIGVGILPVVAALTWLLGNPFRAVEDRVLGSILVGAVLAFGLYTAVKASYLSTNFAIRVEERNFIYVAPVVFAVVARWAFAGRSRIVPLALAGLGVWYLLDTTPYHNEEHFYSDAPGLAVLQWLNQKIYFTTVDARRLVFAILAGTVIAMLTREALRRRPAAARLAVPAGVLLAAAVIGWNVWGEIAAASASSEFSEAKRGILPTPPSWIDNQTGAAPAFYFGQSMAGSEAFWSLEFWNRSIIEVWSTDATAPGPGPVRTPNFLDTTGALDPQLPVDWVVAGPGVTPAGRMVEQAGGLRLYRVTHPIRLLEAVGNVSTDANWMSMSSFYYRFTSGGTRPGTAVVTLSRAAACGGFAPSPITVKVSSIRIDDDGQPVPAKVLGVKRLVLRSDPCETKVVRIPARPPYRVDVTAGKTFQPSESDRRELSAQVSFAFVPRR